jgi:hypothetical protein
MALTALFGLAHHAKDPAFCGVLWSWFDFGIFGCGDVQPPQLANITVLCLT